MRRLAFVIVIVLLVAATSILPALRGRVWGLLWLAAWGAQSFDGLAVAPPAPE